MKIQHPMSYLWANIASLMGAQPDIPGLLDRVQRKTGVGRGIIQRIQKGPADLAKVDSGGKVPSVELNSLVAIAESFSVEVWELLRPKRQIEASPSREFVLASLIEMAQALEESELVSLTDSLKAAIAEKRKGETPGGTHEAVKVYFGPERRTQVVSVPQDRRDGPVWKVDSTRPKRPPPPKQQEGAGEDQT